MATLNNQRVFKKKDGRRFSPGFHDFTGSKTVSKKRVRAIPRLCGDGILGRWILDGEQDLGHHPTE
jgi:hypothetical protein